MSTPLETIRIRLGMTDLAPVPLGEIAAKLRRAGYRGWLAPRSRFLLQADFFQWLKEGRKRTTVRYRKGRIDYPSVCVAPLWVTEDFSHDPRGEQEGSLRITHYGVNKFSELTDADAIADGFSTRSELLAVLQKIYGEIKPEEEVSIYGVEWIEETRRKMDKTTETRLRRRAARRGWRLSKSRRRDPGAHEHGRYAVFSVETGEPLFGHGQMGPYRFDAEGIKRLLDDWKRDDSASAELEVGKTKKGKDGRELINGLLPVQLERIPKLDSGSPEWAAWCKQRGFDPLASGRRAWCNDIRTYLRGAEYLVYSDGGLVDAVDGSEVILRRHRAEPDEDTVDYTCLCCSRVHGEDENAGCYCRTCALLRGGKCCVRALALEKELQGEHDG